MSDKVYKIVYVEQDLESVTLLKRIIRSKSVKSDFIIDVVSVNTLTQVVQRVESNDCDLVLLRDSPNLPSLGEVFSVISMRDINIISIVEPEDISKSQHLYIEGAVAVVSLKNVDVFYKQIIHVLFTQSLKSGYRIALEKNRELVERSSALLSTTSDLIAYVNDGLFLYANNAFLEYFGFSSFEDVQNVLLLDLISAKDATKLKKTLKVALASEKPIEVPMVFKNYKTGEEAEIAFSFKHSSYEGESCVEVSSEQKTSHDTQPVAARMQDTLNNRNAFFRTLPNFVGSSSWLVCIIMENYFPLRQKYGPYFIENYFENVANLLKSQLQGLHIIRYTDETLLLMIPNSDMASIDRIGVAITAAAENYSYAVQDVSIQGKFCFIYSSLGTDEKQIGFILKSIDQQAQLLHFMGDRSVKEKLPGTAAELSEEEINKSNLVVEEEIRNDEFMPLQKALNDKTLMLNFLPVADFSQGEREYYLANYDLLQEDGEIFYWNKGFTHTASNSTVMQLDNLLIEKTLASINDSSAENKRVMLPLSMSYLMDPEVLVRLLNTKRLNKTLRERVIFGYSEEAVSLNMDRALKYFSVMKKNGLLSYVYGASDTMDERIKDADIDYVSLSENYVGRLSRARNEEDHQRLGVFLDLFKSKGIKVLAEGVNTPSNMALVWEYAIPLASGGMVGASRERLDFDFSQIMM